MTDARHLVSVVLPTYNRSATILRAVRSVLGQTYENLELLVVDDGSTDDTREVLQSIHDARLHYLPRAVNGGAAAARNDGVRAARGAWIAFQDSDDEWLPQKLHRQMEVTLGAEETLGMVYTDMLRVGRDGRSQVFESPVVTRGRVADYHRLEYQVLGIGQQTALVRRQCFDEVGFFDETLPRFIDLEFFIRLVLRYDAIRIPEQLVNFYENPGISSNKMAGIEGRRRLMRMYGKTCGRRFRAAQEARIAETYLHLGHMGKGVCAITKAFAAFPFSKAIAQAIYRKFIRAA